VKLRETLAGTARELAVLGVESPRVEAELLLAAACGLLDEPRAALLAAADRELTTAEARTLARLILERGRGAPVQYLIGRAWFRDLSLEIGPGALIPRPETEVLAGEVIAWLGARAWPRPPLVLDLGTGSGCIALALATEVKAAHVVATDRSTDALRWAAHNRARVAEVAVGIRERVSLLAARLFDAFEPRPLFDAVVSNPPYVAEADAAALPREVREHEPHAALFAGPVGLDLLRAIVDGAPRFLFPGALLALEVGEGHADNVAARLAERGAYAPARIVCDLAGRARVVLAERLSESGPAHG
jgi:release factor glutamine methyltransferase